MEVLNQDGADAIDDALDEGINGDEGVDEDDEDTEEDSSIDLEQYAEQYTERMLYDLANNDPGLDELTIMPPGSYHPSSDDEWERIGNDVGDHTHLRMLNFSPANISEEHIRILFRGVARNESVRTLSFEECENVSGECMRVICRGFAENKCIRTFAFHRCYVFRGVLRALAPFFQNNHNFEELHFSWCRFESEGSFTLALSEFTSLKRFKLEDCHFSNDHSAQLSNDHSARLIMALSGHMGLNDLHLDKMHIGRNGGDALVTLLCNSECRIVHLNLGGATICNEGAFALASGLAENTTLKKLYLHCIQNITELGWIAIFTALRSPSQHCRIEVLCVCRNQTNDAVAHSLANLLRTNRSLTSLNLDSISQITAVGWREVFIALRSLNCKLKSLYLRGCELLEAADALPAALGSTELTLESLYLNSTGINDATAISLAESLVSNTNLIKLDLSGNTNITITGWSAFSKALCDTSSIIGTFTSNHTLQTFGSFWNQMPESVEALLSLNMDHSKDQAARLKIIKTHFSRGFAAQPFADMKLVVLPHAIAWMSRYNESGKVDGSFYGFLRGTFSWCDRAGTQERKRMDDISVEIDSSGGRAPLLG